MVAYYAVAAFAPLLVWFARWSSSGRMPWRLGSIFLNPFDVAALGLLIIFAGSRDGVGTDYAMYANSFDHLDPKSWAESVSNSPYEPGFTWLALTLKSLLGASSSVILLIISALTVTAAYVAIRLVSPMPEFAVLLYILFGGYVTPFNTARQGFAVALLLLAAAVLDKSRVNAGLVAGVALTLHASTWVAAPLLLVLRRLRIGFIAMVVAAIAALAGASAILAIPQLQALLALVNERYLSYLAQEPRGSLSIILIASMHLCIATILFRAKGLTRTEQWWLSVYALAGPVTLLGLSIMWASRLSEYLSIFVVLIVPPVLQRSRHRVTLGAVLVLAGLSYFTADILNFGDLLPYRSWILPL